MEDDNRFRRPSFKVYPIEATSEKDRFSNFIEESGGNAIFIEAVTKLFRTIEKPENPMEWFRFYFRELVPDRNEELKSSQESLKNAILKQESRLIYLRMEENKLQEKLQILEYKSQNVEFKSQSPPDDIDYKRYNDFSEDFRWRMKPDPGIRVTKSDILFKMLDNTESSTQLLNPEQDLTSQKDENEEQTNDYDDYQKLYFGKTDSPDNEGGDETITPDLGQSQNESTGTTVDTVNELSPTSAEAEKLDSSEFPTTSSSPETENEEEEESERTVTMKSSTITTHSKSTKKMKMKILKTASLINPPFVRKEKEVTKQSKQTKPGETPPPTRTTLSSTERNEEQSSSEGSGDQESIPPDPLLLVFEPIEPSFWKKDFSLATHQEKASENANTYDWDDEDYMEPSELGDEMSDIYMSSRGGKKKRQFRSQIIHEALWKPDRGKSIEFDTRFDLEVLEDFPLVSPSTVFGDNDTRDDSKRQRRAPTPSLVTALISENTINARELDKLFASNN